MRGGAIATVMRLRAEECQRARAAPARRARASASAMPSRTAVPGLADAGDAGRRRRPGARGCRRRDMNSRSSLPIAAQVAGTVPAHWPDENAGITRSSIRLGQRREAVARRRDHLVVGLRELALQPVHVHVVDAGQPPERLVGLERRCPAAGWRESAPKPLRWPWIARPVWRRSVWTADSPHQLRLAITQVPPSRVDQVGMAAHRVGLVGDVERDHHVLAGAVAGARAPRAITAGTRSRERRMRGVGADLVVLDEVDAGRAQRGRPAAPVCVRATGRHWA